MTTMVGRKSKYMSKIKKIKTVFRECTLYAVKLFCKMILKSSCDPNKKFLLLFPAQTRRSQRNADLALREEAERIRQETLRGEMEYLQKQKEMQGKSDEEGEDERCVL